MSPLTASSVITQSPLTLNRSAVPLAFVVLTRALLLLLLLPILLRPSWLSNPTFILKTTHPHVILA